MRAVVVVPTADRTAGALLNAVRAEVVKLVTVPSTYLAVGISVLGTTAIALLNSRVSSDAGFTAVPFGAIGVTPTPYGGKWAHEDARRSAKIAGANVVESVDFSQSTLETDPLTDEQVRANLREALAALLDAEPALVA